MDDTVGRLPSLADLGYQMPAVWWQIEKLPDWTRAIAYVDRLLSEAKHAEYIIHYYWNDISGHPAGISHIAYAAIDSVVPALETESEVVRGLEIRNSGSRDALKDYASTRIGYLRSPIWVRVLWRERLIDRYEPPFTWIGRNLGMLYDVHEALPLAETFSAFCARFLNEETGTAFTLEEAKRIQRRAKDTDRARVYLPPSVIERLSAN